MATLKAGASCVVAAWETAPDRPGAWGLDYAHKLRLLISTRLCCKSCLTFEEKKNLPLLQSTDIVHCQWRVHSLEYQTLDCKMINVIHVVKEEMAHITVVTNAQSQAIQWNLKSSRGAPFSGKSPATLSTSNMQQWHCSWLHLCNLYILIRTLQDIQFHCMYAHTHTHTHTHTRIY